MKDKLSTRQPQREGGTQKDRQTEERIREIINTYNTGRRKKEKKMCSKNTRKFYTECFCFKKNPSEAKCKMQLKTLKEEKLTVKAESKRRKRICLFLSKRQKVKCEQQTDGQSTAQLLAT